MNDNTPKKVSRRMRARIASSASGLLNEQSRYSPWSTVLRRYLRSRYEMILLTFFLLFSLFLLFTAPLFLSSSPSLIKSEHDPLHTNAACRLFGAMILHAHVYIQWLLPPVSPTLTVRHHTRHRHHHRCRRRFAQRNRRRSKCALAQRYHHRMK